MFRIWFREFKDNHMIADLVIEDDSEDTRTHKIMNAIGSACAKLDIQNPIWLDKNIKEFKMTSKTRFDRDSFIEDIPFDHLEVRIIEED